MNEKILKIFTWIMLLIVAGIIFWFSHDSQAETLSKSAILTDPLADRVLEGMEDQELTEYEVWSTRKRVIVFVRKTAHFLEFAAFGFFLCQLLVLYKVKHPLVFATLGSMLYAISDEIHQLLMKTREPRVTDVLVDTAGGLCGAAALLLLFWLIFKWKKKRDPLSNSSDSDDTGRNG